MTEIRLSRDEMRSLLKKPDKQAAKIIAQLNSFSGTADFGSATDKITLILRIAMESAHAASIATQAVTAIANEAVDDLAATEESVLQTLDNFSQAEFGE